MSLDRTLDESALFRICFICTGNICRSPMAEAVFNDLVTRQGYERSISVMSAGTGADHGKVAPLLSFDQEQAPQVDVPDPYYSDSVRFDTVLDAIERGSSALFRQITPGIRLGVQ